MRTKISVIFYTFIVGAVALGGKNSFAMMEIKDLPKISREKFERAELEITKSHAGISFETSKGIFEGECYSKVNNDYSHFSENTYLTIVSTKQDSPAALAWFLPDYYAPATLRRALNPAAPQRDVYSKYILENTKQLLNGEFIGHTVKNYSVAERDGNIFSTFIEDYSEKSFEFKNWNTNFFQHNGDKIIISVSEGDLRFTYPAKEVSKYRKVICVWFNKLI